MSILFLRHTKKKIRNNLAKKGINSISQSDTHAEKERERMRKIEQFKGKEKNGEKITTNRKAHTIHQTCTSAISSNISIFSRRPKISNDFFFFAKKNWKREKKRKEPKPTKPNKNKHARMTNDLTWMVSLVYNWIDSMNVESITNDQNSSPKNVAYTLIHVCVCVCEYTVVNILWPKNLIG